MKAKEVLSAPKVRLKPPALSDSYYFSGLNSLCLIASPEIKFNIKFSDEVDNPCQNICRKLKI